MKKLIILIDNLSGIGGWVAGILMAIGLVHIRRRDHLPELSEQHPVCRR